MKKLMIISSMLVAFGGCYSMQPQPVIQADHQQQHDWRSENIILVNGGIKSLQNHECETATVCVGPGDTTWTLPVTALAHSYHGFFGRDVCFSARIYDKTLVTSMIKLFNGVGECPAFCEFTIMKYCSTVVDQEDDGTISLKPQYAFFHLYNGKDTACKILTKCKIYDLENTVSNFAFEESDVSFHPRNGLMLISGNTHHLGFKNDKKTRVVLYRTRYQDEKSHLSGMIVLLGQDAAASNLSESLKEKNTFTNSWNAIVNAFPQLARDLHITPVIAEQPIEQNNDNRRLEAVNEPIAPKNASVSSRETNESAQSTAAAQPETREQRIDALRKAVQHLCNVRTEEAYDQAWAAYHNAFQGSGCFSNEAEEFKVAICNRRLEAVNEPIAPKNASVSSRETNESSQSDAAAQPIQQPVAHMPDHVAAVPQPIQQPVVHIPAPVAAPGHDVQDQALNDLTEAIENLRCEHDARKRENSTDARKNLKITGRDRLVREAWEAFDRAFKDTDASQDTLMEYAMRIYTFDDKTRAAPPHYGSASLNREQHQSRKAEIDSLIELIENSTREDRVKLAAFMRAIKAIYDTVENDRSSARFLQAESLARIAYRDMFDTEELRYNAGQPWRQPMKDIFTNDTESGFASAHKWLVQCLRDFRHRIAATY